MNDLRTAAQQALEALTPWMDSDHTVQHAAYHALRAALAQQAEPVDARAFPQAGSGLSEEQVAGRIAARAQAKLARNYELADSIRAELAAQGIELKDGTQGTTWVRAPTPSMAEIQRLRAERDALVQRLREVRAQLNDTTEAALNAWAADRLARHGIPMPEAPACPDCHGIGYDASGQTCACQENPSF